MYFILIFRIDLGDSSEILEIVIPTTFVRKTLKIDYVECYANGIGQILRRTFQKESWLV